MVSCRTPSSPPPLGAFLREARRPLRAGQCRRAVDPAAEAQGQAKGRAAGRGHLERRRRRLLMLPFDPPRRLVLPPPISVNNLFGNVPGKGRVITPEYRAWKKLAAERLAIQQCRPTFTVPVEITYFVGEGPQHVTYSSHTISAPIIQRRGKPAASGSLS